MARGAVGIVGGALGVPVLVLDDESDYASINTKEETIRQRSTRRSATSWPVHAKLVCRLHSDAFREIFVDHGVENDLFPRDFVYSLEAPRNYVGSVATFGTS